MGVYDTLIDGERQAQIKCFNCEMNTYKVGDRVPYDGSLVIVLPSRGENIRYAIVKDSIFFGFTNCPPVIPTIIDKWGEHLVSYDDFKDPYEELTQNMSKEMKAAEG